MRAGNILRMLSVATPTKQLSRDKSPTSVSAIALFADQEQRIKVPLTLGRGATSVLWRVQSKTRPHTRPGSFSRASLGDQSAVGLFRFVLLCRVSH